jgi:hypothetical protein
MDRVRLSLVSISLVASGCSPANVPPEEAKVTLSKPRIEHSGGVDTFLVDFKFTHGRPERGWQYQLVIVSERGNEYTVDRLLNEKQTTGTLEGTFKHFDAREEPGKRFEAYFQMRIGSSSELRTLSNTVDFNLP